MIVPLRDWQMQFREGIRFKGAVNGLFAPETNLDRRFFVYSNGYWLRLSESIREDFPLTLRLLGAASFEKRMREFKEKKNGYELELGELSPAFADFLRTFEVTASLERALQLDLLALESRRAPEPVRDMPGGFGLHPSVRFYESSTHCYCLWRDGGFVRRERLHVREKKILDCFVTKAGIQQVGERIEALAEEAEFVQEAVSDWTQLGCIVSYSPTGE